MKILEPLKQAFKTEDGEWDFGELHYFALGVYLGLILGTFIGTGIVLLLNKLI